ncbi:MAG: MerR family transcriptional regulator [Gammaproteobacteria bacterium]
MSSFRVKDLARACGVSADAVRYYVQIGLLTPTRDQNNRYQLFDVADVKRVLFIRRAKRLGYTLKEIRKIFAESSKGRSPCPLVREIIRCRIVENRRQLDQDMMLQKRMERAFAQWRTMPDGVPDGDTICQLIEYVVEA